jgi:hypothetical protein
MSHWNHEAFKSNGKAKHVGLRSWWADPEVAGNREAFQKRLVDEELARMNGNQRFGGSKQTHDKFTGSK